MAFEPIPSELKASKNEQDIPEGYKRTELGTIPEDWDVKELREIADFTNGKAHENFICDHGGYVVVNSKFISSRGEIAKYSNENFVPAKKDSILMVMSDVPNGRAIAKCFLVKKDNLYTVNQRICALKSKIDPQFLFYKLDRNPFYLNFDDGVKQTNLRKDDVLDCKLSVPTSKQEQSAISTVLCDTDTLVAEFEKLIAKKQAIKQAAMQELFTGKRRLPGFRGEWIRKPLGELGVFKNGINKAGKDFGHGFPFVNLLDVFGIPSISRDVSLGLVNSSHAERSLYNLNAGDVLFVRSSVKPEGVGLTTLVRQDLPNTVFSGFLIRFRDSGQLELNYKEHCFASDNFRTTLISHSTVSANTNINQNVLKTLKLLFPLEKEEQTAIAAVVSNMNSEILALEQKLAKYKQLKQGMMQVLLTGKIRLKTQ